MNTVDDSSEDVLGSLKVWKRLVVTIEGGKED